MQWDKDDFSNNSKKDDLWSQNMNPDGWRLEQKNNNINSFNRKNKSNLVTIIMIIVISVFIIGVNFFVLTEQSNKRMDEMVRIEQARNELEEEEAQELEADEARAAEARAAEEARRREAMRKAAVDARMEEEKARLEEERAKLDVQDENAFVFDNNEKLPKTPDKNVIKNRLKSTSDVMRERCQPEAGDLVVRFSIMGNGTVKSIKADRGSLLGSPDEACILQVLSETTFPPFRGYEIPVSYHFRF